MNNILRLVFKLIHATWLYYLAQILVTSSMWRSGFDKMLNFDATIAEMLDHNLTPAAFFAGLTIFVQLAGAAVAIFGRRFAWLGAGALGVFTLMTICLVHHFWTYEGAEYVAHLKSFQNHMILIGGLILSAMASVAKYHSDALVK